MSTTHLGAKSLGAFHLGEQFPSQSSRQIVLFVAVLIRAFLAIHSIKFS